MNFTWPGDEWNQTSFLFDYSMFKVVHEVLWASMEKHHETEIVKLRERRQFWHTSLFEETLWSIPDVVSVVFHYDTEQGKKRKRTDVNFCCNAPRLLCWAIIQLILRSLILVWEVYNSHTTTPPYFLVACPKNMNICHLKAGTCSSVKDVQICTGVIQPNSQISLFVVQAARWEVCVSSSASLYNLWLPTTCFSMEIHYDIYLYLHRAIIPALSVCPHQKKDSIGCLVIFLFMMCFSHKCLHIRWVTKSCHFLHSCLLTSLTMNS